MTGFTAKIRSELLSRLPSAACCRRSMLAGLLVNAEPGRDGSVYIRLQGEEIFALASSLISELYGRLPEAEKKNCYGRAVYETVVMSGALASLISSLSDPDRVSEPPSFFGCRSCSTFFTAVPTLQLKLGFDCIPADRMAKLSPSARQICQIANLGFDESSPFVGGHSFRHKAGMHIDGVRKSASSFEHIDPALVGNSRSLIISELAGRSAMAGILRRFGFDCPPPESDAPDRALEAVRKAEEAGCQFDSSEASLYLLIARTLGKYERPFLLKDYKLIFSAEAELQSRWTATVKFEIDGRETLSAGEGDGPVNALDIAGHIALADRFPFIAGIKMVDIKARIDSNDSAASASIVRVFVEYGDGNGVWRTMGAATDIIAASWSALLDAYEYCIVRHSQVTAD